MLFLPSFEILYLLKLECQLN